MSELAIGKAVLLGGQDQVRVRRIQVGAGSKSILHVDDLSDIVQKPAVDLGPLVNVFDSQAQLEGVADEPGTLMAGSGKPGQDFVDSRLIVGAPAVDPVATQSKSSGLQTTQRFLQ